MDEREESKLRELLEQFVKTIITTITDGLTNVTIKPQYEECCKLKVIEFDRKTGQKTKWQSKKFLKPYWGIEVDGISQEIKRLDLYEEIVAEIAKSSNLDTNSSSDCLEKFIKVISFRFLSNDTNTPFDISRYINSFMKDIKGEVQKYTAEVELKGILLHARYIRFDNKVMIKKPTIKDFEKEFYPGPTYNWHKPDPTAFLYISKYDKGDITGVDISPSFNKLQKEIDKIIKILRLFKVGYVEYIQYFFDTDSIVYIIGPSASQTKFLGVDSYLISRDEVKKLKKFWLKISGIKLPIPLIGQQQDTNEISIAFDRYNDSLQSGVIEKRISSAMMGLESLYLSPSEQQEMGYRLRMRVSKLLSLIGYKPSDVRIHIQDAYNIRSTYVHGGLISKKDRRKYEDRYGDLNDFSKIIMDYLRASIVALLKRPSKTKLIKNLDDSFLDIANVDDIKNVLFSI